MEPVAAQEFSIGYSPDEDRLVLVAKSEDRRVVLMVTRRLARGLITGLSGLLERTSAVALQAEQDHRRDVIAFEREAALSAVAPAVGRSEGPLSIDEPPQLLTSLNIKTHPQNFELEFVAKGGTIAATATIGRAYLHKFLDMLESNAKTAEWDLDEAEAWAASGAPTVIN